MTQKDPQALPLARRMAATDALFWYAEEALPRFRSTIGGLYVLGARPEPRRLDAALDRAIARVPRLRQRVLEVPWRLGLPEWVDDPHFDRRYHLRHLSLAEPGDDRHLLDLAATLFATPLDRQRPLWEATWIDGLAGDRSAYFFKMHHSMVDGVGSLAILNAITQGEADEEPEATPLPDAAPLPSPRRQLLRLLRDNAATGLALAGRGAELARSALRSPGDLLASASHTARGLRAMVRDGLETAQPDPLSLQSSGLQRRFDVWQVSLEELRKQKHRLGATVNDIVLAALAGALGDTYRERGFDVDVLKCMVPMNLRGRSELDTMGNRVGMFSVLLPLDERDLRLRLTRIREQSRAAKEDQRAAAGPFAVELAAALPGAAFRFIAEQAVGQVNVVCTNVPGVRRKRYMAGAPVEAIYPFASVVEGTPVVLALLSYGSQLSFGLDTDPEAIPRPERLAERIQQGLRDYVSLS